MKLAVIAGGLALALVPGLALADGSTTYQVPPPGVVGPTPPGRAPAPYYGSSIGPDTPTTQPMGGDNSAVMYAPMAPPPPRGETAMPAPAGTSVWNPGHWSWNGGHAEYSWVNGGYINRPATIYTSWIPGTWQQTPQGWLWVEGHWQ